MRKIKPIEILVFVMLFSLAAIAAAALAYVCVGFFARADFRGVAVTVAGILLLYVFGIALYRLFLAIAPLPAGEVPLHSRNESVYHIYLLFFLVLFYPVMRSGFLPVPLLRMFYLALGARLGSNTYTSGILFDPIFVSIGDNSIVGQGALVIPHAIEGEHLSHEPVRIGNQVTIGANAVVLQGCVIEDGAVVAIGAVVAKGTHIGRNEVWGGIPAKRLSVRSDLVVQ